ncbi:MAG: hypothetical protein J0H18_19235, partial [Rhizobiales bacterium]|nr:hypothetical protein [Hyphomicrobiales bacterium]
QPYSPFVALELLYEILYMRGNHASGRRETQFAPNQRTSRLERPGSLGADSGNDRTRTFARDTMRLASVPYRQPTVRDRS